MRGISDIALYSIKNPSSIREIMNLVADFQKHPEKYPKKLIYLGGGWPQDPPPRQIFDAYRELSDEELRISAGYPPTKGDPDYLEAICKYEREVFGGKFGVEEIISGNGSTDLTSALFKVLLNPGDEVVLTRPSYLNYDRQIIIEAGMDVRIKRWNLIKDHFFSPNIDELQEIVTDRTKLLILTSPGNPDGQVIDDDLMKAVIDIAEERKFYILLDEAYRAFHFEKEPRYISNPYKSDSLILLLTLSKELRLPGWRMSHIVANPDLIRAIETVEQAKSLAPSRLPQRVFVKAISKDVNGIKKFIREYTPKKYGEVARKTVELMREVPKIEILEPKGGFYVFFDASMIERSSSTFVSRLLKEQQVALAPGADFGMEGWVRLSFAPSVEDLGYIEEGINRIKEFVTGSS
ncbi:MAG: pyridoxal phosphate-dependent aminotransferase [Candidatus Methanodesulfokora washburnensis]|uniref:Pyridoxal phosphate-dependent aminotransferase n=1 Tax=Candidatus Methanodesulfokora washburnensis TaxID=2478471 RepID=A0A429GQZ5_9CREN|nr:pyridoxal phosphate-dependent aminotransferase [Candidatus Methanodesulfokores washburnensis]RSN76151.1 pyridoxal phosphate-dependent aminotransferase [Candidatus Methanodesulfokores washburnensis]